MKTEIVAQVTFPEWETDSPWIKAAIVKAAAEQLLKSEGVRKSLEEQIRAQLEERTNEQVIQMFETVLSEGQDSFAPSFLTSDFETWAKTKVDKRGRTVPGGFGCNQTRLEFLVLKTYRQFYNQHLTDNIRAVMEEYGEEIDARLRAHIKSRLSTLLSLEMQSPS